MVHFWNGKFMNQINPSLLLNIASCNQIQILLCCLWLPFNKEFLIALMNTGQSIFDSPLQMGKESVRMSCGENQRQLQCGKAATRPQATNQSKWKVLRLVKETSECSLLYFYGGIQHCLWEDQCSHDRKKSKELGGRGWGFHKSSALLFFPLPSFLPSFPSSPPPSSPICRAFKDNQGLANRRNAPCWVEDSHLYPSEVWKSLHL